MERKAALTPKNVARSRSAKRQSVHRSGWLGLPSNCSAVQPVPRDETHTFHMIQLVDENQKKRSRCP